MKHFCLLPVAVLLVWPGGIRAAQDALESRGFQHFYNLEYDQAVSSFELQTLEEPTNPNAFNHLAQSILFRDMFRAGALESELVTGNNPFFRRPKVNASPEDQRRFDAAIRQAMTLTEAALGRNPRDTSALYAQGVAYGLRANYNFLVRKAWRDALKDATNARRLHTKVTEIDPSFIDARLTQGAHEYIVGSLSFTWRLLGFLAGFRGNKDVGIRTLQMVANRGAANRMDAKILLCAIYRREKKPELAIPLLTELIRTYPRNYLFRLELAQMYSDAGDGGSALAVLDRLEDLARVKAAGFSGLEPGKIAYAKGNIQFWYNDLDGALANLKTAAAHAEDLDLNTGVLAWMRLGQVYDLKGVRSSACAAYKRAIAFAPDSDAARESRGYLDSPYRRKG